MRYARILITIATSRPPHAFLVLAMAAAPIFWCPIVLGDTLALTNGDKLTGEIQKLAKGQLSVKLAYSDDPLVLDWTYVASVTTEKPLKVTFEDGTQITAKLQPAKESGSFLAAGKSTPVELKKVVKAAPAEPPPKGFADRFYTDSSITYEYVGASAFQNLNWITDTAYYGDKWEPLLDLAQNFNGNGVRGLRTSTLSGGILSINYYLTDHVFLFPWLAGEKLKVASLGYGSSVQAGGGVGWAFNRAKNHRLLLQGGFVADKNTISLNPPGQNLPSFKSSITFPASLIAFNWTYSPNDNVTVKTRFVFYHALDNSVRNQNQLGSNVEVDIPLFGPVSLTFQARDYANPLGTSPWAKRTLNLSTGFEISY